MKVDGPPPPDSTRRFGDWRLTILHLGDTLFERLSEPLPRLPARLPRAMTPCYFERPAMRRLSSAARVVLLAQAKRFDYHRLPLRHRRRPF